MSKKKEQGRGGMGRDGKGKWMKGRGGEGEEGEKEGKGEIFDFEEQGIK